MFREGVALPQRLLLLLLSLVIATEALPLSAQRSEAMQRGILSRRKLSGFPFAKKKASCKDDRLKCAGAVATTTTAPKFCSLGSPEGCGGARVYYEAKPCGVEFSEEEAAAEKKAKDEKNKKVFAEDNKASMGAEDEDTMESIMAMKEASTDTGGAKGEKETEVLWDITETDTKNKDGKVGLVAANKPYSSMRLFAIADVNQDGPQRLDFIGINSTSMEVTLFLPGSSLAVPGPQ